MNDDFSNAGIPTQRLIALLGGVVAYLPIAAMLHVPPWHPDGDTPAHYLAIGAGVVVAVVVFVRIRQGTWTRRHIDDMLDVDADL